MTFAERLKEARKAAGMSQETLADRLGVSRQAVTKWETERGIPDIGNMITISNLFGISVDEFLSQEKDIAPRKGYLYESRTEYDIDGPKHFDMKLGGAAVLKVTGIDGEKLMVRLGSNELSALEQDLKVKIDDIRGCIDVEVKRQNKMTEAQVKEHLIIEVFLPLKYLTHVELQANCGRLEIEHLDCGHMEFGGRTGLVRMEEIKGHLEIDCNLDMELEIKELEGSLKISQISATSRIKIPANFHFRSIVKGHGTSMAYLCGGKEAEDFSDPEADTIIELAGIKSELVIDRTE